MSLPFIGLPCAGKAPGPVHKALLPYAGKPPYRYISIRPFISGTQLLCSLLGGFAAVSQCALGMCFARLVQAWPLLLVAYADSPYLHFTVDKHPCNIAHVFIDLKDFKIWPAQYLLVQGGHSHRDKRAGLLICYVLQPMPISKCRCWSTGNSPQASWMLATLCLHVLASRMY